MKYEIEEVSPVKRKIKVEVPSEEANAAIAASIAMYRKGADIKGFRKGKVPSSIIESRYKKQIYSEATTDLINTHINEILNESKITPLSRINVDAETLVKDEDFSYSIDFEVRPDIELPEYKGLKTTKEKIQVNEEEVEKVIERLRQNMAESKIIEDVRNPKEGDIAVIDFKVLKDGELYEGIQAENFELPVGEDQALPGFEDIVKKLKPGESTQEEITFPEDFLNEKLANQTVDMQVKLHAVKEKQMPEVDDEFAKKAGGFESVDKMKEAIEKSYLDSREQIVKSEAQKKLLDQIVEQADFALPEAMVESQVQGLIDDLKHRLERKGKSLESTGKREEDYRQEYRSQAEEIVKSQLVLLSISEAEEMEVSQQEIDQYLQQMAIRTGQDFQQLRDYHVQNNLMFALRDKLLCDKAMDIIYDNAVIEEVEPEEKSSETEEEN